MDLSNELGKLADLRSAGALTDQEFADAKRKLLAGIDAPQSVPPRTKDTGSEACPDRAAERTYWSSRWSANNFLFRDSVVLSSDRILFRKRRIFGSREEHINYRAIASIRVKNGIFLSNLSIETSGGSQPIFINGLWKSDAKDVQNAIRGFQEAN